MEAKADFTIVQFRQWIRRVLLIIFLAASLILLPPMIRNAQLINRIDQTKGFFYSKQRPAVLRLPDSCRRFLRTDVVPGLRGILGPNWPGIFKDIRAVRFDRTASAADVRLLKGQTHLQWLSLEYISLKTEDLAPLRELDSLTHLDLLETGLFDDAAAFLAQCHQIESLNLTGTEITVIGLNAFLEHPNLKHLGVPGTIPLENIEEFRAQKPNCHVEVEPENYYFMRPQSAMSD